MVSADVLWQCVKKQNAFLVKRSGVQFSKEKGNLKALNTFKYSGLVNANSVNIAPAGDADDLKITYNDLTLKGYDVKQMARKIEKTITRADLKKDALSKVTYTHKALRAAKAGVKKSKN
eukprot:CAMPEP_0118931956 /NCGR_PEP_ID=MMETSP1169-20130426/8804_1 /TAXON_ID=36882 /ORGANISM="Pyramimonas obovata, Strain CCMP722" /LENGTH=118 /DNA_ID=CAMNT_0006874539 /DNA_START=63 /DNA_END=419 /DNA_ORIENTATION=+